MRFIALAERRPRDGARVEYRLRPGDPVEAAVFDATRPAWVTTSGHTQTARPHHEWRATIPAAHLEPHLRRELRKTLARHPDLIDELDGASAESGRPGAAFGRDGRPSRPRHGRASVATSVQRQRPTVAEVQGG